MIRFMFFAIVGVITTCLLYVLAIIYSPSLFGNIDFTQSGTFGDSWGALTSVFSALGFCGVLWTLKSQNDSIRKVEEESVRREKIEIRRDFENSFFNMLNILQTIIKDMKVEKKEQGKSRKEGRAVFTYFYTNFRSDCINNLEIEFFDHIDSRSFCIDKERDKFSRRFDSYFSGRSGNFSHYYRFLYNIFRFISDAQIEDCYKKKYANILRAQISNYELLILLYNGNAKHGVKFKEYFNDYAVLDNLPVDKLISDAHVLFFDEKSWGDNAEALVIFEKAKQKNIFRAVGHT